MATSEHVARVLLDATGPLAELHHRVLEAGCEVDPEWKLGIQQRFLIELQCFRDLNDSVDRQPVEKPLGEWFWAGLQSLKHT